MHRQLTPDLVEVEHTSPVNFSFRIDRFDPVLIISTETIIDLTCLSNDEMSYANKIKCLIADCMNDKYLKELFEYGS